MGTSQSLRIQYAHEAASSINLSFALLAFVFLMDPTAVTWGLFRMDGAICRHLGLLPDLKVPKDSFTEGYFAFFLPAIALAACSWVLLRLLARAGIERQLPRSVAGLAALAAAPTWWLCATYAASRRYGWSPFAAIQSYEVVLVLVFATLYLSGKWSVPEWAVLVALMLHYGFWFWQFGRHLFFMGYGGPVAPTVGLCAGVTWVLYLRRAREGLGVSLF
jgi:hypothetical protein